MLNMRPETEHMVFKFNLIKFERLFLYFLAYSVLGWIYEVFLEVVVYRWGFTNRGVLFGPYCPVYGTGALLFILLFRLVKGKKHIGEWKIIEVTAAFLICMFSATVLELFASYLLEYFTGSWPWQTYKNYAVNFQGRIALSTSVRFGLGGLLILYCIQPVLEKQVKKTGPKALSFIFAVLIAVFLADCAAFVLSLF